jgi:hypothetical protein
LILQLCQAHVGTHLVDLGPNWIHGTQNNPILDLVRSTNTPTHDWPEEQVAFGPDGVALDEDVAKENAEVVWSLIGDAFKHSNEASGEIDAKLSLMDYIEQHVDERVLGQMSGKVKGEKFEKEAKRRKELVLKLAELWGGFIGATTARQSLKFLWLEECLEGENLFCAGTYAKVLEVVAAPALQKGQIKFEHVVNKISSTSEANSPSVTVSVLGKGKQTFDEVIVTCPLGWLKRNKHVFEPALPTRISQAIASLGYGNLDKVYITFPRAWWDDPVRQLPTANAGQFEDMERSLRKVTATATPQHEAKKLSSNGEAANEHYVGFTTFIAPEYARDTNPDAWYQDCINLAALPKGTEHPTLLFYISGPTADHIAALLRSFPSAASPTRSVKPDSALRKALWQFFSPYVSRLPNFSAQDTDCIPSDILATGWTNDEFAGYGSYSNFPVGATECDQDIEAMREGRGLTERGVWFAGEHTAPFVASGTVTGAYWAGEKVGERVLEAWGLDD